MARRRVFAPKFRVNVESATSKTFIEDIIFSGIQEDLPFRGEILIDEKPDNEALVIKNFNGDYISFYSSNVIDDMLSQIILPGGPQGAQGFVGPQGLIGPQGVQGVIGFQGPQGVKGPQGIWGIDGADGIDGNQGPQGIVGPIGPQGFIGPQGVQGIIGPQGVQGIIGPQGVQGIIGPQGFQGNIGLQGVQGIIGPQGVQGVIGFQGPQGFQGKIGPQGVQGIIGPQGFQGVIGFQGPQGLRGPQGFQGVKGPQGFQGRAGNPLNIIASYDNYTVDDWNNLGIPGQPGDAYMLSGHLVVWDELDNQWEDMGNLVGPQGAQGIGGTQGVQGVIGPQGVQGIIGPQGIQGIIGPQGFQGNSGTGNNQTILRTVGVTNNVFDVDLVSGSSSITENTIVSIIFEHSFDHQKTFPVVSNVSDQTTAPCMAFIVCKDGTVTIEGNTFSTPEEAIPLFYRSAKDSKGKRIQRAPLIGIDPITHEKYTLGIDSRYSDSSHNNCIHDFIFSWKVGFKSSVFKYGAVDEYSCVYASSTTQTSTYDILDISQNVGGVNNKNIKEISEVGGDIICLTKIGDFDTVHKMKTVNGENVINGQEIEDMINVATAFPCGRKDAYLVVRRMARFGKTSNLYYADQETATTIDDELEYIKYLFQTSATTFDGRIALIQSFSNTVWSYEGVDRTKIRPCLGVLPTYYYHIENKSDYGRILVLNTPHAYDDGKNLTYDYLYAPYSSSWPNDKIDTMHYYDSGGTPGQENTPGNIDPFIYTKSDLYNFFKDKDIKSGQPYYYYYAGFWGDSLSIYGGSDGAYVDYLEHVSSSDRYTVDTRYNYGGGPSNEPWRVVETPISSNDLSKGYRILSWENHFVDQKDATVEHAIIHLFEPEECDGDCCHPRVLETVAVSGNTFTLSPVSGSYPIQENDEFTVIFRHESTFDPYIMLFFSAATDIFEGTNVVAGFYKNTILVEESGATYPAPLIQIDPTTGKHYEVCQYDTDPEVGSGAVHRFIFSKCSFPTEEQLKMKYGYDYNSYELIALQLLEMNSALFKASYYDTITIGKVNAERYYSAVKIGDFRAISGSDSSNVEIYREITYNELKSLRDNNSLVPNMRYRIIDYITTTTQADTQSAGHQFDLIVLATSVNTLDCQARAVLNSGDTYFSSGGNTCDLSKWQIWYDIENNIDKYAWADSGSGKGVIYRMIDDLNNDCPYDFKNIQFKENGSWVYTFSTITPYGNDSTLSTANNVHNNIQKECLNSNKIILNNNLFFGTLCYSNIFEINCCNNKIVSNYCHSNVFGSNCTGNTLGYNCFSNIFGDECYNNTLGQSNLRNTFGNQCYNNTFGNGCYNNTFGNDCNNNTFGNECYSIRFGDSNNQYGVWVRFVNIGSQNQYIRLYNSSGTPSVNNALQNIQISQGVNKNTFTWLDISTIPRNLGYTTTVARASDNTLKIYNMADLIP